MFIVGLVLLVGGFFFPPLWLGLLLLVVFLVVTRGSRRDTAIENRVRRMISAGENFAVFEDLYFEAAKSYAVAKGSSSDDNESASTKAVIDGEVYMLYFSRAVGGGTSILVEDYDDHRERMSSLFSELTKARD